MDTPQFYTCPNCSKNVNWNSNICNWCKAHIEEKDVNKTLPDTTSRNNKLIIALVVVTAVCIALFGFSSIRWIKPQKLELGISRADVIRIKGEPKYVQKYDVYHTDVKTNENTKTRTEILMYEDGFVRLEHDEVIYIGGNLTSEPK